MHFNSLNYTLQPLSYKKIFSDIQFCFSLPTNFSQMPTDLENGRIEYFLKTHCSCTSSQQKSKVVTVTRGNKGRQEILW